MPAPGQPPAGWFPDAIPGQLRYWDGVSWTEHIAPDPNSTAARPLRPLNQWLSEAFRLVIDRAGHLFTLLVVITLPIDLASSAATWVGVQDVVVRFAEDDTMSLTGAGPLLWLALVLTLVSTFAKVVLLAAAGRHVLAARTGVPEPWSDTLAATVRRLPRTVGATLLFAVGLVVAYFAAVIPLVLLAVVAPVLSVVGFVLAVFVVGAYVVRCGLGTVASVVAPAGQGGMLRSLRLTQGHTVPLIGRMLMLAMISFTMVLIGSLFASPFISGEPVELGADDLRLSEVFGTNLAAFGLGQLLASLSVGAATALIGGALGLLHADLGGPVDDSITDVDLGVAAGGR
jgi:hypothetical protein